MKVYVRRFIGNPLSLDRIRSTVLQAVLEYARDVEAEYLDTVRTFDAPLSAEPIADKLDDGHYRVNIYVRGPKEDVENYMRLERGFERHVPVVPGYTPKTRPGIIGSFEGGGVIGRGVLKQPVKVEAREFTKTIAANIRDGAMPRGRLDKHVAKRIKARIRVGGWEKLNSNG